MLKKGDYVLATKYGDGDPGDHWCVGFFSEMLPKCAGDRFLVVDGYGNNFRANGFRRCEKISEDVGRYILSNKEQIDMGCRSLWGWARIAKSHVKSAQRGGDA